MGTAGLTGIHHFMLGSVTEKVLRNANMPVLTVRAVFESDDA
jgi:nucleotide-binding universal stress UspA family protein